jgi:hypothetical protein
VLAGATTAALTGILGHDQVVRSMPNTPARLGKGMTVWYATPETTEEQRAQAAALLGALGVQLEVDDEKMVAMATAVSGTGPTYVFLVMEALIDAAVHLGFPRHIAHDLVIETLEGRRSSPSSRDASGRAPEHGHVTGGTRAAPPRARVGPAADRAVRGGLGRVPATVELGDQLEAGVGGSATQAGRRCETAGMQTRGGPSATASVGPAAILSPRQWLPSRAARAAPAPADRLVAFTSEAAGARQLFHLSLRWRFPDPADRLREGDLGPAVVPGRPPDRYVRDERGLGHGGRRLSAPRASSASQAARVQPRCRPTVAGWPSCRRRRGWSQVWLIDAPVPRRGRPAAEPKPPEPTVLTESGIDVDAFEWSPDGGRLAVMAHRQPEPTVTSQIALRRASSRRDRDHRR